jgi:hypothetical protein
MSTMSKKIKKNGQNSRTSYREQLRNKEPIELVNELDAKIEEMTEYDFDVELVQEYLAVLREKTALEDDIDPEQAFAEFREKFALQYEAAIADPPKRRMPRRRLRNISIAAAAACLVLAILVLPKDASGNSYFDKIMSWGEEVLSIRRLPPGGKMILPADSESEYRSIAEALEQNGIPSNNCPTWIPEGFALAKVISLANEASKGFLAVYQNGEISMLFTIRCDTNQPMEILMEKDPGANMYCSNGREFFVMTNMGIPSAVWADDHASYQISGDISMEDLHLILDSIKDRR